MSIIREIGPDLYGRYAEIDPSYKVTSVLKVIPRDRGLGGFQFVEEEVPQPYQKGADGPLAAGSSWPPKQESGEFATFLAMDGDLVLGGVAVIVNPGGAFLFERRDTLAGIWDIRVRPNCRQAGVGCQLLLHAADWAARLGRSSWPTSARLRGERRMETQRLARK